MAPTAALSASASLPSPRSGVGGAETMTPAAVSSRMTPAQPEASANAPGTRTTLGVLMGVSFPEGWGAGSGQQRRGTSGIARICDPFARPRAIGSGDAGWTRSWWGVRANRDGPGEVGDDG